MTPIFPSEALTGAGARTGMIRKAMLSIACAALLVAASGLFTPADAQYRRAGVYRGPHGGVAVVGGYRGPHGYRGAAIYRGPRGGVAVGYRSGYYGGGYGYRGYYGGYGHRHYYGGGYGYRGYYGGGYGYRHAGYQPYYGYGPRYYGGYNYPRYYGGGYYPAGYLGPEYGPGYYEVTQLPTTVYDLPPYEEPGYRYSVSYGYGGAVDYCSARFASYNPYTGTYLGWDGFVHTCP